MKYPGRPLFPSSKTTQSGFEGAGIMVVSSHPTPKLGGDLGCRRMAAGESNAATKPASEEDTSMAVPAIEEMVA